MYDGVGDVRENLCSEVLFVVVKSLIVVGIDVEDVEWILFNCLLFI